MSQEAEIASPNSAVPAEVTEAAVQMAAGPIEIDEVAEVVAAESDEVTEVADDPQDQEEERKATFVGGTNISHSSLDASIREKLYVRPEAEGSATPETVPSNTATPEAAGPVGVEEGADQKELFSKCGLIPTTHAFVDEDGNRHSETTAPEKEPVAEESEPKRARVEA